MEVELELELEAEAEAQVEAEVEVEVGIGIGIGIGRERGNIDTRRGIAHAPTLTGAKGRGVTFYPSQKLNIKHHQDRMSDLRVHLLN